MEICKENGNISLLKNLYPDKIVCTSAANIKRKILSVQYEIKIVKFNIHN